MVSITELAWLVIIIVAFCCSHEANSTLSRKTAQQSLLGVLSDYKFYWFKIKTWKVTKSKPWLQAGNLPQLSNHLWRRMWPYFFNILTNTVSILSPFIIIILHTNPPIPALRIQWIQRRQTNRVRRVTLLAITMSDVSNAANNRALSACSVVGRHTSSRFPVERWWKQLNYRPLHCWLHFSSFAFIITAVATRQSPSLHKIHCAHGYDYNIRDQYTNNI